MRAVTSCGTAALTALLLLVPAAAGLPRSAAAQTPEDDPPAAAPAEDEAEPEADGETEDESESDDGAEPAEEEEVPEGVRRRRPRTEQQERDYKQRKTRQDPFLNPPLGGDQPAGDGQFYDPAEWLSTEVRISISNYVVQDGAGTVVGQLAYSVERVADPVLGEFVHIRQRSDYERPQQTDLWLYGDTLKPRRKEVVTQLPTISNPPPPGADSPGAEAVEVQPLYRDTQRLEVDYLFDRLVIKHRAGNVTATRRLRMLPFSYDIDQLPMLPRQLEFREASWPFEALICDPANETHLALYIEAPQRIDEVLSADAQYTDCYQLSVRLGEHQRTYWVQRLPPYKLVKFTDGIYTYTISAYLEQS